MVADIERVVARPAGADNRSPAEEGIVQASYAGDADWLGVKDCLAAGDTRLCGLAAVHPWVEKSKDGWGEYRPEGILPHGVVDADEKRLCGQGFRPSGGARTLQGPRVGIDRLRNEKLRLEIDDRLLLIWRWRGRRLRVAERRVYRLMSEIEQQIAGVGRISDFLGSGL